MKKIIFIALMLGIAFPIMAQNTREIKGTAIDKNGNPLPGVRIEATGGAENTVTDADGTFTIEVSRYLKSLTATYPGMKTKKLRLLSDTNNILCEMREAPSLRWFVNGMGSFTVAPKFIGEGGVMFGQMGNWGWFLKGLVGASPDSNGHIFGSASVGAIKRIVKPMYIYLGAGFGSAAYYNSSYYYGYRYLDYGGICIDLGFIFNIKDHFNITIGASVQAGDIVNNNIECWDWRFPIQVGFGYTF